MQWPFFLLFTCFEFWFEKEHFVFVSVPVFDCFCFWVRMSDRQWSHWVIVLIFWFDYSRTCPRFVVVLGCRFVCCLTWFRSVVLLICWCYFYMNSGAFDGVDQTPACVSVPHIPHELDQFLSWIINRSTGTIESYISLIVLWTIRDLSILRLCPIHWVRRSRIQITKSKVWMSCDVSSWIDLSVMRSTS